MTRRPVTGGFVFQAASLVVSAILVHALYVTVVWPRAASDQAAHDARMQLDPTFVAERSIWIILRDYEQESEIVLMLWALAIIGQKALTLRREQRLFQRDLVALGEGMRILPEDVPGHARTLQTLPEPERSSLLPRALLAALHRFGATGSIADASASAHGVSGRGRPAGLGAFPPPYVDGQPRNRLHRHRARHRRALAQPRARQ